MKKKIISMLFILVMIILVWQPIICVAESEEKLEIVSEEEQENIVGGDVMPGTWDGDIEYGVWNDNEVLILRTKWDVSEIKIPSMINGMKVTGIDTWTFSGSYVSSLKITIPSSVTYMSDNLFFYKDGVDKHNITIYGYEGTRAQSFSIEHNIPFVSLGVDNKTDVSNSMPNIYVPNYMFNSTYYADMNPDVKAAFGYNEQALKNHYLTCGIKEGRRASSIFDARYYLQSNADLRSAFGATNYEQAYFHFVNFGRAEGRRGVADENAPIDITNCMFDGDLYYSLYPDLQQAIGYNMGALKRHYLNFGVKEGRIASYVFDGNDYLQNNPDVNKVFGGSLEQAYYHFVSFGVNEGRKGSKMFDVKYYVENNQDIKKAYGSNYSKALEHFLNFGIKEGRSASSQFNAKVYRTQNTDLSKAFGNDWKTYFKHYLLWGARENRKCV